MPTHYFQQQSRQATALAWLAGLVMAAAVPAVSAVPADTCTLDGCGAGAKAIAGKAELGEAARRAIAEAVRAARPLPAAAASAPAPAPVSASEAWDRQLRRDPTLEAYDCILSAGIAGALARDGFIGTRAFGHTQVWRDGQKP